MKVPTGESEQEPEEYAIATLKEKSGEVVGGVKKAVSKIRDKSDEQAIETPQFREVHNSLKDRDVNIKKKENSPVQQPAPQVGFTRANTVVQENTPAPPEVQANGVGVNKLKEQVFIANREKQRKAKYELKTESIYDIPTQELKQNTIPIEQKQETQLVGYKRQNVNSRQQKSDVKPSNGQASDLSIDKKSSLKIHEKEKGTIKTRPHSSLKDTSATFKPNTANNIKTAESTVKTSSQAAKGISQTAGTVAKSAGSAASAASGVGLAIQVASEVGNKLNQAVEKFSNTQKNTEDSKQSVGILAALGLVIAVPLLVVVLIFVGDSGSGRGANKNLSDGVLSFMPMIIESCTKYEIPEYVEIVAAIMMQESGGDVEYSKGDVMQSAESQGLPVGTPLEPAISIDYGVKHFKECLTLADMPSPADINSLSVQGYNFGTGYITWAKNKHGSYSQENANEFSDIWAAKMGWSSYGDKLYVSHVLRYYEVSELGAVGDIGLIGDGMFAYPMPDYKWTTYFEHEGIDLPGSDGKPIYASASGTVSFVQNNWKPSMGISDENSYGNCVYIDHGSGYQTRYAHMIYAVVAKGQYVRQGQVIGYVGSTGNSSGPHLHFSVYYNGSPWAVAKTLCYAEKAFPQYKK